MIAPTEKGSELCLARRVPSLIQMTVLHLPYQMWSIETKRIDGIVDVPYLVPSTCKLLGSLGFFAPTVGTT